jgi:hypothetical protein
MRQVIVALGIVLVCSACASRGGAGSDNTRTTRTTQSRTTVITAEEIAAARGAANAADLVRQLRPNWPNAPVFVGNNEFGGPLSAIDAGSVREIRLLSASEAQMRWGMRVREVILVTRK